MLVEAKFPPLGLHPKSQDVLLALPLERQPIKVSLYVYFSGRLSVSVAFWVTNPCRITRKVKQTKMYVCTLEEFILVDIWIHCCTSWN